MPDAVNGVKFGYLKTGATALAEVDPDIPFLPFRLWLFQDNLQHERQVYSEIRIENDKLRLEFPGYGVADDDLFERIRLIFAETHDQPHLPIRPVTVFRRRGDVALDPTVPITVTRLSQYMRALSVKHDFDPLWRGKMDSDCYLSVSFDTPQVAVDKYAEIFEPSFEGACTISIRTYNVPPGMLQFMLTYGGMFSLDLGRAEAYGFANIEKLPGMEYKVMAFGRRSTGMTSVAAFQQDLNRAVLFAQALGCHPVGGVSVLTDRYTRTVRQLGPLGDWVSSVPPGQ